MSVDPLNNHTPDAGTPISGESSFMEPLQLAGQIIMENGGETYRAEETICRMGEGFGLRQVESFAVPSGLFISYRDQRGNLETGVKRVHRQETNLTRVDEVNRISRQASLGQIAPAAAAEKLRHIARMHGTFSGALSILAAFTCAAGFAVIFGGYLWELLLGGFVAALVQCFALLAGKLRLHWMAVNIIGGLLTALLPNLAHMMIPGLLSEAVIAGALMPLVPGLAMTNAVQDTLRGDMVSGLSHGVQALLTACLIAGGALLSPALMRLIQGGGF
ncbi:MAG: threonine/serine exporter family protein [Clostridia bacterium]|nr:threonine/serine exporter family protein [Clostridia bacterium]